MRITSQNLNEPHSILWHGRAWLRTSVQSIKSRIEWQLGRKSTFCHAYISVGDCDDGVMLALGIPWLFSVWVSVPFHVRIKSPHKCGVAIHSNQLWLSVWVNEDSWERSMPWWEKNISYRFPWDLEHYTTEVLEHKAENAAKSVYMEGRHLNRLGEDVFDRMRQKESIEKTVSEVYEYKYTRKNGEVQHRKATVHVSRMVWRALWWPIIPISKSRTSIDVKFDAEVGEGTGSWKGGCIGCGMDMLPGETPFESLRRMEATRKFGR